MYRSAARWKHIIGDLRIVLPLLGLVYAWFAELPDDAVLKISPEHADEDLVEKLGKLVREPAERERYGRNASDHVREHHSLRRIAAVLASLLKEQHSPATNRV